MPASPILVSISSNEAMRPRAEKIKTAIAGGEHFRLVAGTSEPPFDLCFLMAPDKILHVEVKDFSVDNNSDYLSSILPPEGHLWEQVTIARELGEPFVLAVLGDDSDIQAAIRKAAGHSEKGKKPRFDLRKFEQYSAMVDGFEANCLGCNIPVWHLGYNQFPRLLLRVRKILEGGDLSGFCPNPADKERQAVGLSILAGRGIGPAKAAKILELFELNLLPKDDGCYGYASRSLEDVPGIGPKLAEQIRKNISVIE